MKKQWSTVFLILLVLIVVLFSVLNVDPVGINFGFSIVEIPLAVVLIGTLLIGVLMAVLLSTGIILKYKSDQKKLKNQIARMETEKDTEKDAIVQEHNKEVQKLTDQNKKAQNQIRDLERRIKNINASHDAQTN